MPCGLNLAPRVFTQLVKVIPKKLTLKGIQVMAYLDDWLVWADSTGECANAMCMGIQTLQDFGFLLHWIKSRLPPAQSFQWLVFHWQLDVGTLALPGTYWESTVPQVREFCFATDFSRRDLEVLQGKFLFACIMVPVLKTTLKAFN